jgi:hypothetical protein
MDASEYRWRQLFLAALFELDSEKFAARLMAADDAVFKRLLELEGKSADNKERRALEDTMEDIRLLRDNCHHFRI